MKVVPIRIYTTICLGLMTSVSHAASTNPPPPPVPPPPPGLSIDGPILLGIIIAISMVFFILKSNKKSV